MHSAHGVEQPQVDDERHMVFECSSFESMRLSTNFSALFEGVAQGDLKQFMQNGDGIKVSEFIHQCMEQVDVWNNGGRVETGNGGVS